MLYIYIHIYIYYIYICIYIYIYVYLIHIIYICFDEQAQGEWWACGHPGHRDTWTDTGPHWKANITKTFLGCHCAIDKMGCQSEPLKACRVQNACHLSFRVKNPDHTGSSPCDHIKTVVQTIPHSFQLVTFAKGLQLTIPLVLYISYLP